MALLGKTLKGRSTKPGGNKVDRNIRKRVQFQNEEEVKRQTENFEVNQKALKKRLQEEKKIVDFNKKKLLTYWMKILRLSKLEQLKNDIDIYSQLNQRELDSKEAFLQMLDKNLDEAEEQYQIILRNHLIHLDHFQDLQEQRIQGLTEEFNRDLDIISSEFETERQQILRKYQDQEKELEDLIGTIKAEEKLKKAQANKEHRNFREETKSKNKEEINHMKMTLEQKQHKYYNELEQLHQKYQSDTSNSTDIHTKLFRDNDDQSKKIDVLVKSIAKDRNKIDLIRMKILQHKNECQARNAALKKEKENISASYQALKQKMMNFREEQQRTLTELVINSKNSVNQLEEYKTLGEKILKTAELCRRLETEKEKVLPFYESTIDEDCEIPEEVKNNFTEIKKEDYEEWSYLNNFYKRINKVLLDKLAIEKQKKDFEQENVVLKNLLKQYLDGISINDEVLQNKNPLFILNNTLEIQQPPVEKQGNIPVVEGTQLVRNVNLQFGQY